jgi:hypothetical protein
MAFMFDEVAQFMLNIMDLSTVLILKGELNYVSDNYVTFTRKQENTHTKVKALD